MKTMDTKEPSADFYNFKIYKIETVENWEKDLALNTSIIVVLKNAETEELALLAKIFQAVGKDLSKDVCIVNQSKAVSYKAINAACNVQKLLLFGISPEEIGLHLNVKAYQVVQFQESEILFSHDLKTIASDLGKKKQLWGQLQVMFK